MHLFANSLDSGPPEELLAEENEQND
jgi:hypothetical protein